MTGSGLAAVAVFLAAVVGAPGSFRSPALQRRDSAAFRYNRSAPLTILDSLVRVDSGIAVHRMSFASPLGGRATGFLAVPADSMRNPDGRFAGMILLHGAPGDATVMLGRAEYLARHGAVVLALDAPFSRRDPHTPLSFTPRDSVDVIQLVIDLRRAVDLLQARDDVDPSRIGFWGRSFGGATGGVLAGVEHRVTAFVLAVADGGWAAHFTNPDGSHAPPPDGVNPAQWRRWFAAMDPVGSIHFVAAAVPGSIFFEWALRDDLVPPWRARQLWANTAGQKQQWYDNEHPLSIVADVVALTWLVDRLALRPVTSADSAGPAVVTGVPRNRMVP